MEHAVVEVDARERLVVPPVLGGVAQEPLELVGLRTVVAAALAHEGPADVAVEVDWRACPVERPRSGRGGFGFGGVQEREVLCFERRWFKTTSRGAPTTPMTAESRSGSRLDAPAGVRFDRHRRGRAA
ncbi:MAG: hypothetical protein ACO3JL_10180 [Myxococcota bacterium]